MVIGDEQDLSSHVEKHKPDILGVSCVTSTYPIARNTIRKAKELYPTLPTIIGGHHATFLYRDVIRESGVDYVCRGEGEEVFVALLASLEAKDKYPAIEGIVFYKDGSYHNDSNIAILDDLDHLPRITFDLVEEGLSFSPKIVSSRGCPFNCSFCSISAFYGGRYRQRKVKDVIEDIKCYVAAGYTGFWFHDDNLTVNGAWVREFCESLKQEQIKISWNCMSRVDTICKDPDLITMMAASGCKLISIGIESGIPEVLEKMHKKIDHAQIDKAISIMNSINISHNWYMIIGSGDEFDTPKHIKQNIRFFRKHRFGYVLISILTPFPGTELYNSLASQKRLLHNKYELYDVMHCVYKPLGMSATELEAYLPKAYVSIYLSKGWRLIPLVWRSVRSGAIRWGMISGSIKTLLKTYLLGFSFNDAIKKSK